MSFFKDFKEDLSQAVNELMPEEEAKIAEAVESIGESFEAEESPTVGEDYSDLFASFENNEAAPLGSAEEEYEEVVEEVIEEVEVEDGDDVEYEEVIEEVVEEVEGDEEYEEVIEEIIVDEDGEEVVEEVVEEVEEEAETVEEDTMSYADAMSALSASVAEEEPEPEPEPVNNGPINTVTTPIFADTTPKATPINTIWDEKKPQATGVIIEGMTVKGDVSSEGSLDVLGIVQGNLQVNGKLNISGKIDGDSFADEIFINGAKVVGQIHSNGSVKVAKGSVIKGNIKAAAAVFAGAVKGDIDVQGPVILDSTAVIVGNVKSKSIQINNGAIIEGSCSQCYSDVTASNYFDED